MIKYYIFIINTVDDTIYSLIEIWSLPCWIISSIEMSCLRKTENVSWAGMRKMRVATKKIWEEIRMKVQVVHIRIGNYYFNSNIMRLFWGPDYGLWYWGVKWKPRVFSKQPNSTAPEIGPSKWSHVLGIWCSFLLLLWRQSIMLGFSESEFWCLLQTANVNSAVKWCFPLCMQLMLDSQMYWNVLNVVKS